MDYNLDKKVALITGSTRGIGKATAVLLAKERVRVVINFSENMEDAKAMASILDGMNAEYMILRADITKPDEVEQMVAKIKNTFNHIDILVNNVGIIRDSTFLKMNYELWDDVIQTNIYGAFNCTKACLPIMLEHNRGSIINLSSVIGLAGNFGQVNYSTSKAAIIGFTKSLAKEYAKYGIRVNAIAPGFVRTNMLLKIPDAVRDEILKRIPLQRFADPEEIATVICFLASDKSSYINGQTICVDGGYY